MLGFALMAAVLAAGGVALIFASWRRWIGGHRHAALFGWLALALSGVSWMLATGAEFGVTLALLVPSVVAWLLVFANRQRRQGRRRDDPALDKPMRPTTVWSRHLLLFLVVVPFAAVASTLVSVAVSMLLPWQPVNAMLLVVIVMPVLWGGVAYWACADNRLLRPVAAMAMGALVSGAFIYA